MVACSGMGKLVTSHHCAKYFPMLSPWAGKETKSSIFLFCAASKRFKWRQRTLGRVPKVCCFCVAVFLPHEGQSTPSPNFSAVTKRSKHRSTLSKVLVVPLVVVEVVVVVVVLLAVGVVVAVDCSFDTCSANDKDTLRNSSVRFRLFPHSSHNRTELRDPSKSVLTMSVSREKNGK